MLEERRHTGAKLIASTAVSAVIMVGTILGTAVPAQAAEWKKESSRSYCYTVSGWQDCYTETTYRRTSQVCAKPSGSFTGGLAVWYSYCHKTVKVRN